MKYILNLPFTLPGSFEQFFSADFFYKWVNCHMLVVSNGSLIAEFTTLPSPSQAGFPQMPSYIHQLSLGYPMGNRLSSAEIDSIA